MRRYTIRHNNVQVSQYDEEKDAFLRKRNNVKRTKARNPCNRGMKLGVHRQSWLIILSLVVFIIIVLKKMLYSGIPNNSTEDPFQMTALKNDISTYDSFQITPLTNISTYDSFRITPLSPQCLTYIRSKDKNSTKYGTKYKDSCRFLPSPLEVADESCRSEGLKNHITSFSSETKNLKRFVMFLATAHSGHSLVGSLLDAHPMMIVSNEADIFSRYLGSPKSHYPYTKLDSKEEIFNDIFNNSLKCALFTRWQHAYNYTVPYGWGGSWIPGELRVIGDKKGGSTSLRLRELKSISRLKMLRTFQEFQKTIDLPIHIIHVYWSKKSIRYWQDSTIIKILNQGMPSHLFSASEWDNDIYTCGDEASRQSLLSDTCSNLGLPCDSHIIDTWSSMAKCKSAGKHLGLRGLLFRFFG